MLDIYIVLLLIFLKVQQLKFGNIKSFYIQFWSPDDALTIYKTHDSNYRTIYTSAIVN